VLREHGPSSRKKKERKTAIAIVMALALTVVVGSIALDEQHLTED
jgi:hypothetical protein